MSVTTTPRHRWRAAAVGLALALTPVTAACGADTAGEDVQQVEEGGDEEGGEGGDDEGEEEDD